MCKMFGKNFQKTIFMLIFMVLMLPSAAFSETIRISTNDYEPYTKLLEQKETGVFIEIIDAAFAQVGIMVKYENYPWKRAFDMGKKAEVDATVPWFETEERKVDFLFSEPVINCTNKFFYVKGRKIPDNFQWNDLSDFKQFAVGGVNGYWYEDSFKKAGVTLDPVNTDDQNIQKLHIDRIDTFVTDELLGWALVKKYFPAEMDMFATLEKPESSAPMYVIVSKARSDGQMLIDKFNEGLKKIKESGEYDKIVAKYMSAK